MSRNDYCIKSAENCKFVRKWMILLNLSLEFKAVNDDFEIIIAKLRVKPTKELTWVSFI